MQRFGWGKRVAPAFAVFVLTWFKLLVWALLKRVNVFSGCLGVGLLANRQPETAKTRFQAAF